MASRTVMTLAFVRDGGKILLGMKKRGFGQGRWNGFGGKVEKGETIAEGAKRELLEECGLFAQSLQKIGCIDFEFLNDPMLLEVHVFTISKYSGNLFESEEMRPRWISEDNIPFQDMWPDDSYWMPYVLAGKKFKAYFQFKNMDTIIKHSVEEVEGFDD